MACSAGVAVVIALLAGAEFVDAVLRWIDRLAPKPGLSGLALLFLSPVAFLMLLGLVEWILNGFGRSLQSIEGRKAVE